MRPAAQTPAAPLTPVPPIPRTLISRLAGLVRLVHPFPSLLDGVVVGIVALLAGGSFDVAVRLGVAMTLLQFGIGATNDLVDAPRDAGHKPGKPIPGGLVGRTTATAVAIVAFVAGLILAAASGPVMLAIGVVVIGIGLAYDFLLKGTAWSWLPFAIGIPILPVFGWYGATGGLTSPFAVLVPVAIAAGAGLAIANALADVERDRAAGTVSVATSLGATRAWTVQAALVVAIVIAAVLSAAAFGASAGHIAPVAIAAGLPIVGLVLGRSGGADTRERAWQVEAIGMAVLGVAWIWAILT